MVAHPVGLDQGAVQEHALLAPRGEGRELFVYVAVGSRAAIPASWVRTARRLQLRNQRSTQ